LTVPDSESVIVLVRHAQSTWSAVGRFQGTSDPPLSAAGERMAKAVARRLGDIAQRHALGIPTDPALVVRHSPLGRATLTAHAIGRAGEPGVPLIVDEDLREVGQGEWEGLTHDAVISQWPREYEAWRRDPAANSAPGGESLAVAAGRASRALETVTAALSAEDGAGRWAVVVAHDGILRLMLLEALRLDLARYWSFPFIQCGITVLRWRAGYELVAHNAAGHLAGVEPVPG
jgi:broad specificity phosphatase PhoE